MTSGSCLCDGVAYSFAADMCVLVLSFTFDVAGQSDFDDIPQLENY